MSSVVVAERTVRLYLKRKARMVCACGRHKAEDVEGCDKTHWEVDTELARLDGISEHYIAWFFNKHVWDNVGLYGQIHNTIEDMKQHGYIRKPATRPDNQLTLFHQTPHGGWGRNVAGSGGADR